MAVLFLTLMSLICMTHGADTEAWKTRVIYQLLTDRYSQPLPANPDESCTDLRGWCGGTLRGIIDRIEYIQNLGADAIWISPIVLNTEGGYHGYWAKDIYQIDPHFGSEEDLVELLATCHGRDIFVMLDVVPNHMGYPPGCSWGNIPGCTDDKLRNVSGLVPFGSIQHYHSLCAIDDYTNQTQVEECRLANLPDLNQTVPFVRDTLLDWIRNMTEEYGFDGYRIDTTRHIAMDFWPEYQQAAGVYTVGEVASESVEYTAAYQGPLTAVLNFPLYYSLRRVFNERTNTFVDLQQNVVLQREHFEDTLALGTFIDNHDQPRFMNMTSDPVLLRNALAYLFYADGIPILYYGTEQLFNGGFDPNNRESLWPFYDETSKIYQFTRSLLMFRKSHVTNITSSSQIFVLVEPDSLAFIRSKMLVYVSRHGRDYNETVTVPHPDEGTEFTNVLDDTDVVQVESGTLTLHVSGGEPLVYHSFTDTSGADRFHTHWRYMIWLSCMISLKTHFQ